MGSIEVKKVLSKGKESSLDNLDIENGKLRFTTDTGRLFLDDDGKRIEITEKGLASLRMVLQNFNSYVEKFCTFSKISCSVPLERC